MADRLARCKKADAFRSRSALQGQVAGSTPLGMRTDDLVALGAAPKLRLPYFFDPGTQRHWPGTPFATLRDCGRSWKGVFLS